MNNLLPLAGGGANQRITFLTPKSFAETEAAVLALKSGEVLLCNLSHLGDEDAQRIADFVSGGTCAISGHQAQIGNGVFLFTPASVKISTAA
ncbi:cell division protein SepF [Lyngbya confervoides]|uniref:Cell division protein SepF n=1 Tax=Lyngbya confervoides BDU141951 TaxID=1574623 RepID=A0ABD4T4K7_9CYAN|nr:cell division protein SepF [Lyngbya confervoides]MCM1983525.1 cell division protein SepF [Lyngbya confervoides BDU141951]